QAKVPNSKPPAAPQKEPSQIPVIAQESNLPQQKSQVSPIEEPKAKGEKKGGEGKEKEQTQQKSQVSGTEEPKAKGEKKGEEGKEKEQTQQKSQAPATEEPKAQGEKKGEEGKEKEQIGAGKRTVSSLILTVKLTLLADPRLFPYEIEVEDGSD